MTGTVRSLVEGRLLRFASIVGVVLLACSVAGCVVEDEYGEASLPETVFAAQTTSVGGLLLCLHGGEPRVVEQADQCDTDAPGLSVRATASGLELILHAAATEDPTAILLERMVKLRQQDAAAHAELLQQVMQAQQDLLDAANQQLEQRAKAEQSEARAGDGMAGFVAVMAYFEKVFLKDTNLNGMYDLLEDSDGDGVLNFEEDQDGDGIIDIHEDDDGDGVPNPMEDDDYDTVWHVVDTCPMEAGEPINEGCPAVIGTVFVVDPDAPAD